MTRRGSSLVAIVLLASLLSLATLRVLDYGAEAQARSARLQFEIEAEAMARSGLRYAEAMIAHRRWTATTRYASPPLGHGERFRVTARAVAGGWELESVGEAGSTTRTQRERL